MLILYIYCVCRVPETLKYVLFADDTDQFRSGKNFFLIYCEKIRIRISKELFDFNKIKHCNKISG